MIIPFFDLKRQYIEIKEELEAALLSVSSSCAYVEGPAVKAFEKNVSEYLGVKHAITCGNGTEALEIALKACGVEVGDEVVTTAFSFFATAEAIASIGAVPVFADVNEQDYNIDPDSVRKLVTDKTKAILPVHIFGTPANMDELNAIANEHGIAVIEDACQAIGSSLNGRMAGGIGNAAAFSFYPTKNLGAAGDGGMITTNDDNLATVCRALKSHAGGKLGYDAAVILGMANDGFTELAQTQTELYDPYKYYNYLVGGNSRLDSMQAAILDVKLKRLQEYNGKRADIARRYNDALSDIPIGLPVMSDNQRENAWHQYVITTDKKEELIAYLGDKGIGTGAFYPVPLHLQKAFLSLGYKEGSLPVSEMLCKKTVCLPIFPELTDEEVQYIIDTIVKFYL